MKKKVRLIALDLDGTLLNAEGVITPRTLTALEECASRGIEVVPATGRFYAAMPEQIRALPFLHYAITINGAAVYDFRQNKTVCGETFEREEAIAIMRYLDTLPVCYDCYLNNSAYMTAGLRSRVAEFTKSPKYREMVLRLRKPVPELKEYVASQEYPVQKIMLFTQVPEVRREILDSLSERFPYAVALSSTPDNVEINQKNANKGRALSLLADYLGLVREETMSFGDGLNDLPMIRSAGIGVCMENGEDELKREADFVTGDNNSDGIADAIERLIFGEE